MSELPCEGVRWGRNMNESFSGSWHAYTETFGDYLCGKERGSRQMSDYRPNAACLRCTQVAVGLEALALKEAK